MGHAVVHVDVDTEPDGTMVVRWEVEGGPVAVDVATGPTPDAMDHRHDTTVPAGLTTLRLDPAGDRGRFVSVAPHAGGPAVVAADRRVRFEGIFNFRDLGGYRTAGGNPVRWGQVFRADSLHGLTERDLDTYERLGLRAVYDLRGDTEREERPNPMPSRVFTIIGRPADALPPEPATALSAADGERVLHDLYLGLIEHAAPRLGALYTSLLDDDGLPAVFHCHAGKDRTGVVAAILLEALGVDREVVVDDYVLTARYRLRNQQEGSYERLVAMGMGPEAAAGVLTTPRWAMEDALATLDERYGGVEGYLTGPAGMTANDLAALRHRLVAGA